MAVSNYGAQNVDQLAYSDTSMPVNTAAIQAAGVIADGVVAVERGSKVQAFAKEEAEMQRALEAQNEKQDEGANLFINGQRIQGEVSRGKSVSLEDERILVKFREAGLSNDEAYSQGKLAYNMFLRNAQARLRGAIANRPDLADEFRRASVRELGIDVGTATINQQMELLESIKPKPSSVDSQDVQKYASTYQSMLKDADSPNQEEFLELSRQAMTMSPQEGMDFLRYNMERINGVDAGMQEKTAISGYRDKLNSMQTTLTTISTGVLRNAEYWARNPEEWEQFKTIYSSNRAVLDDVIRDLSTRTGGLRGKEATEELKRATDLRETTFANETLTMGDFSASVEANNTALRLFADPATVSRVARISSPTTSKEALDATVLVAQAYEAPQNEFMRTPPTYINAVSGKNLGVAMSGITMDVVTPDRNPQFHAGNALAVGKHFEGTARLAYQDMQSPKKADEFIWHGMGTFYDGGILSVMADATTFQEGQLGEGWMDRYYKANEGNSQSKTNIQRGIAYTLSGANKAEYNEVLNNLPTEKLRNEYIQAYGVIDVALVLATTGKVPVGLKKIVINDGYEASEDLKKHLKAHDARQKLSNSRGKADYNKLMEFLTWATL